MVDFAVDIAVFQKVVMLSHSDDPAVVKDDDFVGMGDGSGPL